MNQPLPRPAVRVNGWQRFVSTLFLVAATLMVTQYAVVRYGPATVLITPFGYHGPNDFADDPAEQRGGLYLIDWATLDRCLYKLDDGTFLPPAEGLVALTFLLALPLLFVLGWRRQVWPRYPLFFLVALSLLSCLQADHFMAGARETAQLGLTLLAAFWLAGAAMVEREQIAGLYRWLGILTVALVVYGLAQYQIHIVTPPAGAELPAAVRATCASRTAYSGLMVILLCLGVGRVLASRNLFVIVAWVLLCVVGVIPLMTGGAVLAVAVAWTAMAGVRGRGSLLLAAVVVPVTLGVVLHMVSPEHLDHLGRSVEFYRRQGGQRVAVEKRYLEMAATLNGLAMTRPLMGTEADENGTVPVLGDRSSLLLGVGAGLNYQRSIGEFYLNLDNPEKQEQDTYNLYFLLALQMGLFAAIAWAWVLLDGAAMARAAYEANPDRGARCLALGVYGACVGVLVFSVFGTILVRGVGLLLFALMGVVARLEWLARPEEAPPEAKPKPSPEPAEPAVPVAEAEPEPAADPEPLPQGENVQEWLREQGLLGDEEDQDDAAGPDSPAG